MSLRSRRTVLTGVFAAATLPLLPHVSHASHYRDRLKYYTLHRHMTPDADAFTQIICRNILLQTIKIREANGCGPLRASSKLYDAANAHSNDMYNRQFFAHVTPEGLGPRERVSPNNRMPYKKLGENLWRTWNVHSWDAAKTAQNVVQGWLDSPGHRRVLLDPDFETGGVAAHGDEDELFVTMLYAKPY